MGVGADLYMYDVVKKFTFAISSPDEFSFREKLGPHLTQCGRRRNLVPTTIDREFVTSAKKIREF